MDISVIIPTYNRAHLIGETLRSILNQSYAPTEIMVVDDGSTDDTEAVVRRFGDAVGYHRIENSGQGIARHVGVSLTRGSWIAFCDSDDLWMPEKLALQAKLCQTAPEIEYTFTNFNIVVNGIWSNAAKFDSAPPGYWDLPKRVIDDDLFVVDTPLFERILVHQPIFPSTVMMTREFYQKVGGWGDMRRCVVEDFEFTLRCVCRGTAGIVRRPVVGIRKHASNISGNSLRATLGEIEILEYALRHHPAARGHAEAIREQVVARSASAASDAFAAGEYDQVLQLLRAVPMRRRPWKLHAKGAIARGPQWLQSFFRKRGAFARQRAQQFALKEYA